MSSCGMPVSNMEGMRAPEVKGLQFWAVIRTLLEECKDVEEAIDLMNTLPVGYNINLYLADANGTVALYETINGHRAYEIKDASSNQYVFGTNHMGQVFLRCPDARNPSRSQHKNLKRVVARQSRLRDRIRSQYRMV